MSDYLIITRLCWSNFTALSSFIAPLLSAGSSCTLRFAVNSMIIKSKKTSQPHRKRRSPLFLLPKNPANQSLSFCFSVKMSSWENAASHKDAEPLRIVLLGKTGTGRSSSGNSILGRSAFNVDVSLCSITTQCNRHTGTVEGWCITVIDTPGFLHTHLSPEEVLAEVGQCVALSSPGPHAFLMTLQPGRFTQEERDTLQWFKATFGPGATRFTTVLFTWGDRLKGKCMEDFLGQSKELLDFVNSCRGGYHVFENSDQYQTSSQQVVQLLEKIDKTVANNGGGCYSDDMFKEAERAMKEVRERILREREHKADKDEEELEGRRKEEKSRREEEEDQKQAERLFWCELVTAVGKGAAEGAGILAKDEGKGKAVKKVKVVERAAALAASPLSITSAAKAVGGAVREGGKVLYKHRKTFLKTPR